MPLNKEKTKNKQHDDFCFIQGNIKFLNQLGILEKDLFGIDAYPVEELAGLIQNSDFFVIALHKEQVIGYICGVIEYRVGHLKSLGVKKEYRKKGVGSYLLDMFEQFLVRKGIKKVYLEVSTKNIKATQFYTKKGYYEIGRKKRFYEDGSDACIMEKTLSE